MSANAAIRKANKASAAQLAVSVPTTFESGGKKFYCSLKTPADLTDHQRVQIWRIFEENMYKLYNSSSFGWDPSSKKAELFDRLSRLILVNRDDESTSNLQDSDIVAYTIFRFDGEEGQDVIYCYELQVSKAARRCGLGKVLTRMLSDIGAQWEMKKVMLTVFKANQSALSFYSAIGFSIDETSPDFPEDSEGWADDECDYSILSIPIP